MKIIWAIIQNEDAGVLIDALTKQEYRLTRINTAGGFLWQGNATLILGVEDWQVEEVMSIIQQNCQTRTKEVLPMPLGWEPGEFYVPEPVEVQVGGATVFVIDLADFRRL